MSNLEDEFREIAKEAVEDRISKIPPVIFPETQQVEITNPPEPPDFTALETVLKQFLTKKAPEIKPTDLRKVEELLKGLANEMQRVAEEVEKEKPVEKQFDYTKVLSSILDKVSRDNTFEFPQEKFFEELKSALRERIPRDGYRGGAIGPSKISIKNVKGNIVDPSTAVKDKETLSTSQPQGTIIAGHSEERLGKQESHYIGTTGGVDDHLKVQDPETNLLKEILVEFKINNLHLSHITGEKFTEEDIQ